MDEESLQLAEHLPTINELFEVYNQQHFEGVLGVVTLEWSNRMTQCAGVCYLKGSRSAPVITIRLSRPLLQFRPFADTISTLLHEMIHAYFFVKQCTLPSARFQLDRDGHGADFQALMQAINAKEGSHITIYHSFHAEVGHFKRHVWRCSGPCRDRPPYFGWVRRAMNRRPQPADSWWSAHAAACTGSFIKVDAEQANEPASSTFKGAPRSWSETEPQAKGPCLGPTSLRPLNSKITAFFDVASEAKKARSNGPSPSAGSVLTCPLCGAFSSSSAMAIDQHIAFAHDKEPFCLE